MTSICSRIADLPDRKLLESVPAGNLLSSNEPGRASCLRVSDSRCCVHSSSRDSSSPTIQHFLDVGNPPRRNDPPGDRLYSSSPNPHTLGVKVWRWLIKSKSSPSKMLKLRMHCDPAPPFLSQMLTSSWILMPRSKAERRAKPRQAIRFDRTGAGRLLELIAITFPELMKDQMKK